MNSTDAATPATPARPAKRSRITVACTWCRQRKSRCDGTRPKCSTCSDHGYDCLYSDTVSLTKTSASKELLDAFDSRLATLESSVAGLNNRVTRVEGSNNGVAVTTTSPHQSRSTLTPNPLNFEGLEGAAVETTDPTDGIGSIVFTKEEESGFFGPSSNIAFTRQIVRTTTAILKTAVSAASPASPGDAVPQSYMLHVSRPPSPAPNRIGLSENVPIGTEPFMLPPESETLCLIEIFFSTTGVLFPYIDKDGFLEAYHQLNSTHIRAVRRSWLSLLNMVLAMSTNASHGSTLTASERAVKSDIFFRRALALYEKQVRHGTSLEIVQLLLLMSQYLQGTERSIETWNVHGLAVKAAYQLGLHSPNALKQYLQPEREIRKRTWFGCIVLDRTLSMTLGRPPSIPGNFIKLDVPCSLASRLSSRPDPVQDSIAEHSVQFFTATITLYTIMGEVVDILYGNNLGCDVPDNVFDIASHLLKFEQKFLAWQHSLPATLLLAEPGILHYETSNQETLRYRFILTMRFLNLRILTHRPLLCKYLEFLGNPKPDSQQLTMLRQVGANSMRTCVQSALLIIKLMRGVLSPPHPSQHLLGAWWFSLYYAFNAALVIYSTLLMQHQAKVHNQVPVLEDIDLSIDCLHQAIECLSLLFKGNRMTEKCVQYTSSLAHLLSLIYHPEDSQEMNPAMNLSTNPLGDPSLQRCSDEAQSHNLFDFLDSNDLHMGMSLDEFFGPDLTYVTSHKYSDVCK